MAIEKRPAKDYGIPAYADPAKVKYSGKDMTLAKMKPMLVDGPAKRWERIESGRWLDELHDKAERYADETNDPRQRKTAQEIMCLCRVVQQMMHKDDHVRMTWHAFELGMACDKLAVLPFEPATMIGRKHKDVQRRKAERRWSTANRLQEKVQERYQRMIDNDHKPAEAKKLILSEVVEDWPQLKALPGAPKNPPSPRSIHRWTQGIKPRT